MPQQPNLLHAPYAVSPDLLTPLLQRVLLLASDQLAHVALVVLLFQLEEVLEFVAQHVLLACYQLLV